MVEKKLCLSLHMIGTCGKLGGIVLSSDSSDSPNLKSDSSLDADLNIELREEVPELVNLSWRRNCSSNVREQ